MNFAYSLPSALPLPLGAADPDDTAPRIPAARAGRGRPKVASRRYKGGDTQPTKNFRASTIYGSIPCECVSTTLPALYLHNLRLSLAVPVRCAGVIGAKVRVAEAQLGLRCGPVLSK